MVQQGEIEVGPQPKYAVINTTTGNNTLVAAVSGKKIRVLSYQILGSVGTVTVRFESAAGGTALTGVMVVGAAERVAAEYSPVGHFETVSGELLNLEVAGGDADGHLTYVEVD